MKIIKNKGIFFTFLAIICIGLLYFSVFKPVTDTKVIQNLNKKARGETLTLYNSGQVEESLSKLEQLDKNYRNDTEIKTALAFAYRALGKKEQSFKKYQEILEYDANNIATHVRLGIYYRVEKQLEKSMEHLEKALKIKRNSQIMAELSKTYEALGKLDDASKLLRDAAALTKDASQKKALTKQAEGIKSQDGI